MHLTFIQLLLILCSVAAYYLVRSLLWTLPLRRRWKCLLALPLLLICYSFPISRAYEYQITSTTAATLLLIGGALTCYLVSICLARDLILLPLLLRKRPIKRLQVMSAPVVVLLAFLFAGVGYHRAYDTKIMEVDVPLAADCAPFANLRVVQLTDLHVTRLTPKAWLEEVVQKTNALQPDIICITGDIADLKLPDTEGHMEPLRHLKARYGVYFVDGNHEYYKGQIRQWRRFVEDLGFIELHNEHRIIEHEGAKLMIAGIPDELSGGFAAGKANVAKAVKSEETTPLCILLSHRSQAVDEVHGKAVDLVLAGHTHGGQFFPWNLVVAFAQPHLKGLYQEGDSQVYVNQGTGFWAIPNRFGTTSEITLFKWKIAP